MQKLNFIDFQFRFKNSENKVAIFDIIRKKFILLTPEEWVRQHVIHFFITTLKYPKSHINVEKVMKINGLIKRYDIVVFDKMGQILILVECKSTEIKINQTVFDQIARYNLTLKAPFLMLTNGLNHFFCEMDFENEAYVFLETLPIYI